MLDKQYVVVERMSPQGRYYVPLGRYKVLRSDWIVAYFNTLHDAEQYARTQNNGD